MKPYRAINLCCKKEDTVCKLAHKHLQSVVCFLTPITGWPSSGHCKGEGGAAESHTLLVHMVIGARALSSWHCKSSRHEIRAGARGMHHSLVSLTHRLSAAPIIAWHYHPYLFSWIFIIYYTPLPGRTPRDPSSIMALKEDLIGRIAVVFYFFCFPWNRGTNCNARMVPCSAGTHRVCLSPSASSTPSSTHHSTHHFTKDPL